MTREFGLERTRPGAPGRARELCAGGDGLYSGKGRGLIAGNRYCCVSFVDDNRQWAKSCQDLEMRETGRENAFCAVSR